MKKKQRKSKKEKEEKPQTPLIPAKAEGFDFGGLPSMDLKKNIGCG